MKPFNAPISKEYGAWASLATAFLAGGGVAGRINLEALILFLGALSFFLARTPLLGILRSITTGKTKSGNFINQTIWFTLYSLLGIALFSLLLFKYKLTFLIIFIILSAIIFSYNIYNTFNKGTRARESSLSGVLGVSLLSSFTYYVATGSFDKTVAALWVLVFLYLAGSIFYVETRLGVFKWQACLVFHIITTIVVSALAITKLIPMLSLVAYYPSFIKSSIGALSPKKEAIPKIRQKDWRTRQLLWRELGRIELLHSVIFVVLISVVYRIM